MTTPSDTVISGQKAKGPESLVAFRARNCENWFVLEDYIFYVTIPEDTAPCAEACSP
jgi:hypothetical protein